MLLSSETLRGDMQPAVLKNMSLSFVKNQHYLFFFGKKYLMLRT